MASLQSLNFQSQIPAEVLIARIKQIHSSISKLESLRPSKQVNSLFTHLVKLCILPSSIDIKALPQEVQQMRESLIILCGRAEGLLELEFAKYLSQIPQPLKELKLFPYYGYYVKLADLEYRALVENGVKQPKRLAFVGSGPMPLTSIIMASHHMKSTHFDNFDIDQEANDLAGRIVNSDAEMEKRMKFLTCDIMEVKEKLAEYDCIFLAALVGRNEEEKVNIIGHIRKYMKDGGLMLVRSAKGARAFLYPVVEECRLFDFKVLSIFHPTNDVINSIILLQLWRKPPKLIPKDNEHISAGVPLLQENRFRKLQQQASLSNSPSFSDHLCPCGVQGLDVSNDPKIAEKKKKKAMAETASEWPYDQFECSSSGLNFADIRSHKRAKLKHLIPLIHKAEKVIPERHAADAQRISLSTTWDIALANLLRVAFLLELHRPVAMKSFDVLTQMARNLELAQKQVTELSEKIRSEQGENRELRNCILQLTRSLQSEKKRRFEVELELETFKQTVAKLEEANNNAP